MPSPLGEGDAGLTPATPRCDPAAAFGTIAQLLGLAMPNILEGRYPPRLSDDELTIYFTGLDTKDSNTTKLYIAHRNNRNDPFDTPSLMTDLNAYNDADLTVSADGLNAFFDSNRNGNYQIYVATRTTALGQFNSPVLATINTPNAPSGAIDWEPFLTDDGQELWFPSARGNKPGVYRAVKISNAFGTPAVVAELSSTSGTDFFPTLSADKLTLYFSSSRMSDQSGSGVWTSHRNSVTDPFPAPRVVDELNLPFGGFGLLPPTNPGWLSPDNCRLYGGSDAGPFVAIRQP
jgi:hypothetical protein